LPEAFLYDDYAIKVVAAPLRSTLKAGSPVHIELYAPGVTKGVLINNGSWTFMDTDGDVLSTDLAPEEGNLKVTLYLSYEDKLSYWEILRYRVEE
jgi:hypothetical protein